MSEKHRALFRGATTEAGLPREWLGPEPGSPAVLDSDGKEAVPAVPDTPAVAAHHLTQDEYDALSPRNKVRVKDARASDGGPLYEVRSLKEVSGASSPPVTAETPAASAR